MSSSEEYLDSLLDSILGGGKPDEVEETVFGTESEDNQTAPTDGGKAMSSAEIEEMLVSMGSLGGAEEESREQTGSEAEDMEAMLAFMNEHNASAADSFSGDADLFGTEELETDDLALEDTDSGEDLLGGFDGLSLDNLDMGESGAEDVVSDDLALDDFALEETGFGEDMSGGLDELSLDDLDMGESSADDMSLDDLSLDDLALDDFALEETDSGEDMSGGLDGLSLDDLDMGESGADDMSLDDLALDDLALDDFALEETDSGEDMSGEFDGLSLDDLDMGESSADDMSLNDLSLDDLALEESDGADNEMDGLMSEEDIDRLLNGDLSGEESGVDDFALEETGESDDDLSALLADMGHDEDLSEINDLLEESDQGVSPDDDMLAMLEGVDDNGDSSFDFFENDEAAREAESIRELTPEEIAAREGTEQPKKEKKKRKKLFGKKKKDGEQETTGEETGNELEALLGESAEQEQGTEEEEKKPGLLTRIMDFLLETDEEDEDPVAAEVLSDNGGETGTVTDENKEILEELKEEDKKGKKKKKKDKKKGKKGKETEGEGEGEEGAEAEEESGKKAKKKKKKEKKKKEEEEVDLFAPPEKKLSKKKVITVFVFCGTIAACIVLLSSFLPNYMEKRGAHVAYDHKDYAEVYDLLYGKKLNEQDEILFQRSNLILQMNRKLVSYENYVSLDMRRESLNALISGVARYQEILPDAEIYNVVSDVSSIYTQILERLSADFGVSEADALDIIAAEDDVTYSQKLEAIINGAFYGEDVPAGRQDVLPEEEEIIERIDGLEGAVDEETPEDMLPDEMMGDMEASDENAEEGVSMDENADEDMPADEDALTDENADEGAE